MEGKTKEEEAVIPRLSLGGGNSSSDRLKRDEWSEGAVSCLLEAYEAKWILRNRAKLKGQDWEDVARHVSVRENSSSSRSAKTATQCKNKVESMKKRYRNEVAAGSGSRWPLFSKIDELVRCKGSSTLKVADEKPVPCDLIPVDAARAQNSYLVELNGAVAAAAAVVQEDEIEGKNKLGHTEMEEKEMDQNAPSCDSSKEKQEMKREAKAKRKRANEEGLDVVVESIRWLAEVMLRVEQTRMEAMREVEKIRAEMEARRGEMDLKRTEIIASTQLEIARLLARSIDKVNNSSSPKIKGKD